MARIFIEGFESGSLDLWDMIGGGSVSQTQKKTGAYAYYTTGTGQYVIKNISSINTIYFKIWIYITTASASNPFSIMAFANEAGFQVLLYADSANKLSLRNGGGSVLATGSTILSLNTWYLIEGKLYIDDSPNGIYQLKLNGISSPLEIDGTGDTKYQSTGGITKVYLGQIQAATGYASFFYKDDFVLDDANWIGDTRIYKKQPTGAGNSANWTPSTGNNWDCVDEIPASDTDYLTTNSNDVVDSYATDSLPGAVTSVKCLQVQARCVREGASTPTTIKPGVRSGTTDYPKSSGISVPVSIKSLSYIMETDPDTSNPWTVNGVNNSQLLIKSAA